MAWRVANALVKMRDQFNAQFPNRNKKADGTIGDAAHASRGSDHNPWIQDSGSGVVSALDITHDPGQGVDTWAIAEYLRTKKDARIKYVISNRRIFSSTTNPWTWRKYTGSNPHSSHMHVSVKSTKSHYDDTRDWDLFGAASTTPGRPVLKRGAKGEAVREVQAKLGVEVDGSFGAGTEKAVKGFQTNSGLAVDGVVGPSTWEALDGMTGTPDPDSPTVRPTLRKGATGEAVKTVQRLLTVKIDGKFGGTTEAAVKAFQRGAGLAADGVVEALTWAELDALEQIPVDDDTQANIVCTVFGGKGNPEKSAYEDRWITDDEHGAALPFRFKGDRPQVDVINTATGKRVVCEIVDVGPWVTDDDYWQRGTRPIAEQYWQNNKPLPTGPNKGKVPNGAGIDITPGAAREIGLAGKGKVNWSFAQDKDEGV